MSQLKDDLHTKGRKLFCIPLSSERHHSNACQFVSISRRATLQPSASRHLFCRVRHVPHRLLGSTVLQPLAVSPGLMLRRKRARGAAGADGRPVQRHVSETLAHFDHHFWLLAPLGISHPLTTWYIVFRFLLSGT
jgi:hypothetical protein